MSILYQDNCDLLLAFIFTIWVLLVFYNIVVLVGYHLLDTIFFVFTGFDYPFDPIHPFIEQIA